MSWHPNREKKKHFEHGQRNYNFNAQVDVKRNSLSNKKLALFETTRRSIQTRMRTH